MATATKRKFISGVSVICAVMLIVGIFPIVSKENTAEATDTGEYYYAPARLYDYYYDTDKGRSYTYDHDRTVSEEQRINGAWNGDTYRGGNRWRTQLQVPFERWNREISAYYENSALNGKHALYFGNFYGTNYGNIDTEQQKTYKSGSSNDVWYSDAYKNFYLNANNAPALNDGRVAVTGLVDSTLSASGMVTQNGVPLPQFNDSFVKNSENADWFNIENGFPFNVNRNAVSGLINYSYDSLEDGNRYYQPSSSNAYSGIIQVQKEENGHKRSSLNFVTVGRTEANKETGFYPFNGNQSIGSYNDPDNMKGYVDRQNINYGFGMRLDIPFNLTEDGTLQGKDGKKYDIVFNFSGDDDIWVFLDGNLVLDMGGDHGRVNGSINFNTAKNSNAITVDHVISSFTGDSDYNKRVRAGAPDWSEETQNYSTNLSGRFSGAYTDSNHNKYDISKNHTMTVFYMERGMFESNLRINFNFQPLKNNLTIKEKTVFDGVNDGLVSYTVRAAEKDAFSYTVQNKGTKASDVPGSGFYAPSYEENISRERAYLKDNEKALFTVQELETKTVNEVDATKFYLEPNVWDKDGAIFIAYMYGNGSEKFVQMDKVRDGLYSVDKENYTTVIFLRCESGAPTNSSIWSSSKLWDRSVPDGAEGHSMTGSKNCVRVENWDNIYLKNDPITVSRTVTVAKQGTPGDFAPADSDEYHAVSNVVYELTDAGGVFTGKTDGGSGSYYLMHDQSSYFTGQFKAHSSMSVVQSDTLGEVDVHNGTEIVSINRGTRSTSDYYDTTVNLRDKEGQIWNKSKLEFPAFNSTLSGGERGIYAYENSDADTIPVDLTEEYINSIKVGNLEIVKALNPDETSAESNTETFKFKLKLTNVFDNGIDVDDYSGVKVVLKNLSDEVIGNTMLGADGTFSIKAHQKAVIEDIPVGTDYEVEEISTGDTFNPLNASSQSGTITANTTLSWTKENTRKTGQLKISKNVVHSDGTTPTADEQNKTFEVVVTLTVPRGVDFSSYKNDIVKSDKVGSDNANVTFNDSGVATFKIKHSETITLDRIPYGTTYTVTEKAFDDSDGWEKSGEVTENTAVSQRTVNSPNGSAVTITNTKKITPKTQYVVQKIWDNYDMTDGTTMSLKLSQNGKVCGTYILTFNNGKVDVSGSNAEVSQSSGNKTWTVTFKDLEKADADGNNYVYDAEEVAVNGVNGSSTAGRIGYFIVNEQRLTGSSVNEQITNTYSPITMPESGGSGREDYTIYYVLFGTGAVMLSALAFFLIINKKRRYF